MIVEINHQQCPDIEWFGWYCKDRDYIMDGHEFITDVLSSRVSCIYCWIRIN